MNLRHLVFHDHRNTIFIPLVAVTTAFAVRPDSTLLSLILALSVSLTYAPFLFRRDRSNQVYFTLLALSIGSSLSRIHASLQALSTTGTSLAALFILSTVLSSFTLAALYVGNKFSANFNSPWSRVTLFPAIWATLWCTVSYLNPLGHLATWSVANNEDVYKWIIPYVGPAGKDWIVAAWAVVISQMIGHWYIGFEEEETSLLDVSSTGNPRNDNHTPVTLLGVFLTFLTIPSFFLPTLPLPVSLSNIDTSTPLTVGCVLPTYGRYQHHTLTLKDYIAESDLIRSNAKVILWPEGAVTFHSLEEKRTAFEAVRNMSQGSYVGVSFEEVVADSADPSGRKAFTRTGLAIISQESPEPHLVYYKRHLVPVAESFRLSHSSIPPSIFEMPLLGPKVNKTRRSWNGSRPIDITSSICLDFAHPSPFMDLPSKPSLILAPARTWDRTVGYAMWLQAKQRAEELNSMVLWCDGGEGGVSGVAGNGHNEIQQVGQGSFVRTIGIEYPPNTQKTIFARFGDSILILLWLFALGPESLRRQRYSFRKIREHIQSSAQNFWGKGRPRSETPPNLLDLS